MRTVLLFPIYSIQSGGAAALVGAIVAIVYIALLAALSMVLFRIGNHVAVKPVDGIATIVNKRVIAAHKEWQGRYLVDVPEVKVLDLAIRGESVTFIPSDWIYDRAVKSALLPVRFRKGRLNGKIVVDRVMYL